jgi:transposase
MPNKLLAYSRLKPGEVKTFDVPFCSRTFASGCDIDKPVGTFCVMYPTATDGFAAEVQQFPNSPTGCQDALKWVLGYAKKYCPPPEKPIFIIESTGAYHILAMETFWNECQVIVVNPTRIKALLRAEGKDDVKDSVTLTKLALSFDLHRSVIATGVRKELRKLLRIKRKLIQGRTQVSNRIGSILTENAVPLPTVMKIMSVSGLGFCNAIAGGETNPDILMLLWQGKGMTAKMKEALTKSLCFPRVLSLFAPEMEKKEIERLKEIYDAIKYVPRLGERPRWLIKQQLRLLDTYEVEIEAIEEQINQALDQYSITWPGGESRTAREAIDLALTAPILTEESARVLIAEMGIDFAEVYGKDDAFCRALGLTAGNSKSAGKVVGKGVTQGNQHFKPMIVQATATFLRRRLGESAKGRYLWTWGRSYQSRSDAQHARIAVARRVCSSLFHMFRQWQPYDDSQHILSQEAHTVKTAKRLANISRELTTKDGFVNKEAAAELRLAARVINQMLGLHASSYRLKSVASDAPLNTLALNGRAINALQKNQIHTISQLVLQLLAGNLLNLPGIGAKLAVEIEQALLEAGYVELTAR